MNKPKQRTIEEIHNDVRFLLDGVNLMLEIVSGVAREIPEKTFDIAVDEKPFKDVESVAKRLNDAAPRGDGGRGGGGVCIPPKCDVSAVSIGMYVAALNNLFQEIGVNELKQMSQELTKDGTPAIRFSPARRLLWEEIAAPAREKVHKE